MGLLALLGPFTDRNGRFFYPFICFKQWNPYPFFIKKGTTFGRSLPAVLGYYRQYPPRIKLSPGARRKKSHHSSGGSRGGARGARSPLIFRLNWGLQGRKKFVGDSPPLSKDLDDRPPPPAYLKVWIRTVIVYETRKRRVNNQIS